MAENGYYVGHSVILYGIKSMGKKIDEDQDYHVILEKIQNCITT